MISQFDEALIADWPTEATVLPLEFESLDSSEKSTESTSGIVPESAWKEQIAVLEARLVAEASTARQEMAEAQLVVAQKTRNEMAAEAERSISGHRAEMMAHIAQFGQERSRYFAEVEQEVVSLALAIAERVLHREASIDPMLLLATVRVALDKLDGDSSVRLRVPAEQASAWSELLAAESPSEVVVVIGESQMTPGDAVLETVVGRVELGVREQLKEIERGFFDLLEKRPA